MKHVNQSPWQEWVRFAKNDLDISIREMERECNPRHRLYEMILMHCQQSAEKILKAGGRSFAWFYPGKAVV